MQEDLPSEQLTYTEIFDRLCPMYLVYGMTWEQFWFGDPWMAKAYREAHLLKRKMRNEELWLEGLYEYHSVGAVIGTAFGKRKVEYLKKPLNIFPKTEIEKKEEERDKKQKLVAYLSGWMKASSKKKE